MQYTTIPASNVATTIAVNDGPQNWMVQKIMLNRDIAVSRNFKRPHPFWFFIILTQTIRRSYLVYELLQRH